MNNREVAHLWANQSRKAATGSNFFFDGPTLYSYGHHFPVAMIAKHPETGEPITLFNRASYSRSTSRHQAYARWAASHLPCYHVRQKDMAQPRNVAELQAMVAAAEALDIAEGTAKKEEARERAKRLRVKRKQTAEAQAAFPEELAAWRLGGPAPRAGFLTGTALRLSPSREGMIETSRSAFVPVSVARKAWPILAAAVAEEEANPSKWAWVHFFSRPDWNWGDYKGLSLRRVALGSPVELNVGCHSIPWREVEYMAAIIAPATVNA
jgi:hypothetical protein